MDSPLRSGLWDIVATKFEQLAELPNSYQYYFPESDLYQLARTLNHQFFNTPMDTVPTQLDVFIRNIRTWFLTKAAWWEVYDFVEFIAQHTQGQQSFIDACSYVMERHLAGYSFVDALIAPIIDEQEIVEIETALKASSQPIASHLAASLELLADRKSPNYRKAVDEAILSVEAAAQTIAGNDKLSLGNALRAINLDLHPAFEGALHKLYGFTSDESGIRHALSDDSRSLDQADARYMLIACSAFVNYLRAKSGKELP
jgi:hypothetical protein